MSTKKYFFTITQIGDFFQIHKQSIANFLNSTLEQMKNSVKNQ